MWGGVWCGGASFAYQTSLFRPRGSRVLFFNRLRLTPMQMEQMPNSNKSALERARICGSHCCEGRFPNLPHPVISNCGKPRLIHLGECFAKGRDTSRLLCWRKAEVLFCFCGIFYHLISTFTSKRPSAVSHKNQLPRGALCQSTVFSPSDCIHLQIYW